jgi:ADP-ribosylglycohydrolase
MRVAPIGLAGGDPFTLGCQAAALTHGHRSGYLAAGALALMISQLTRGRSLSDAAVNAIDALRATPGADQVTDALTAAIRAAEQGPLSADSLGLLGQGWVAEEALAIATHCAITATNFRSGVLHAVNHGGDSDSTGAICGNLLGTSLGAENIDTNLMRELEGRDVITQIADDLCDVFAEGHTPPAQRYPAG